MARTAVVWCPDWPVRAAEADPTGPVAVVRANRVVACSPAARADGVAVGLRRRQAEARSPGLVVVPHDPAGEARRFEPVVAAVAAFTPRVEVVRPGVCAFTARGPARYFGGEERLATLVAEAAEAACPGGPGVERCQVGVADGLFAAGLAARYGVVVEPGRAAEFLAPMPVRVLGMAALVDLLDRLGIRTLGQLARLPSAQVLSRFGAEGATAQRRARGLDDRPLATRPPPDDLTVTAELDPPVERVDAAAFAAKSLADRLHAALADRGLSCTQVGIEAETEHGETLVRWWRHDGQLTSPALAERVRWQLEGWLGGPHPPTSGLVRLRLTPDEVVVDHGSQQGFWGGVAEADRQAARALARVQALLGPDTVLTAVPEGGRGPAEVVRLVPWGDDRGPARPPKVPWPGRVPAPLPAVVPERSLPAELADGEGRPLIIDGRGQPSAPPRRLSVAGGPWSEVVAWSAPWPCQERWWDPGGRRRRARMQVETAEGRALLLVVESGRWLVEAVYD
ncbi:MAG TPA: DNA polymerase Y family protein [Acidimicrobiales bacterium]|nr:DNA polymerase Y family protein [Acidimicrobiales bacterium]